jgi:hypothetical protein
MPFMRPGRTRPDPDLSLLIEESLNAMLSESGNSPTPPLRIAVLRQVTVQGVRPPESGTGDVIPIANVSALLVSLADMPPDGRGVGLLLAVQAEEGSAWVVSSFQTRSIPTSDSKPFTTLTLISPWLGIVVGIFATNPGVARLHAELPDGTILEDNVVNQGLLLYLPGYVPSGWSPEEAPVLRLLDATGNDLLPPERSALRRGPRRPPDVLNV